MVDELLRLAGAKRLLREQLAKHPDPGVRLLNEVADVPDDHPAVQRIAEALRANESQSHG